MESEMANVKPIPQGYTTVTPTITCSDTPKAIEFYRKAFGATERTRMPGPDGKIIHAEIQIGSSRVMLQDEIMGNRSAQSLGSSPVGFYIYIEDCDAMVRQAVAAGAKELNPVTDMFWGDRVGHIVDPFGYHWSIATHRKDLSPEEMKREGEAWMKQMAGAR
jgi:PhnB protein